MDYGDSVAAGKYQFRGGGFDSTLVLKLDHTFLQTTQQGNAHQESHGTWRHLGEGSVTFSEEFLPIPGHEVGPDGSTVADIHKVLGLFASLKLRQYHILWYGRTSSGSSLSGTYQGDELMGPNTLTLNPDHSFNQALTYRGAVKTSYGTWKQESDGTVVFSNAFLKTNGEPLSAEEVASSMDPRGSNLQIEVSKAQHSEEPIFHKW